VGGGERLEMLHWNIHSWRDDRKRPNHQAVEDLIRRTGPDVVSLTEVSTPWGDSRPLSEIAERVGYRWVFVPALEYRGSAPGQGYGNALLTRLPILGVQQWRVHSPERYANTEPSEPRTVALARVDVAGTPVWVGSTHLPASQADDRAAALRRLAEQLKGLGTPWLVCGDFNTAARTWREDLPDGVTVAAPRWRRATFPVRRPVRAIDYGLASPSLRTRARVLRSRGSDHRAIFVSAGWGGTPPARPPRA
jgi:endonuclease/exonuclease/phosphatase family metal-dependent hydrolase